MMKSDDELIEKMWLAFRHAPNPQMRDVLAVVREHDGRDAERFHWYISSEPKGNFLNTYLRGVREKWTLDQWRAAIDSARKGEE